MQSVIVGMGEIGSAFYQLLKPVCGLDLDPEKCRGTPPETADILHICIPFLKQTPFIQAVLRYDNIYRPKEIIIHSSVEPLTTEKINYFLKDTIIAYSPFRGVHSRMIEDMKRYVKHYAFFTKEPCLFVQEMREAGINIQPWNDTPTSLELAKLWMDVVYYGWLIIFAQHTKVLADRYGVDEKNLWRFTDEIHKYLGNRPRMFSGEGIGGHCVMQDKDLLNDPFLDAVFSHDEYFRRNLKNGR
jgi:UDP-N-acetyl-D-mannosaminuronate dehydrogenase